jgi:hypothetical protein
MTTIKTSSNLPHKTFSIGATTIKELVNRVFPDKNTDQVWCEHVGYIEGYGLIMGTHDNRDKQAYRAKLDSIKAYLVSLGCSAEYEDPSNMGSHLAINTNHTIKNGEPVETNGLLVDAIKTMMGFSLSSQETIVVVS